MQKNAYQQLVEVLGKDRVRLDEPMAFHTTFKIGGPADLFYEAESEGEIVNAVGEANKLGINYFILGNGSNILVGDKGYRGLVIKIKNSTIEIKGKETAEVLAGAGASLSSLIEKAAESSLADLEFVVGIPGSVGGAVRGNAGAWGQAVGDFVKRVKVLTPEGEVLWLDRKECQFEYRGSRFKKTDEVILAVEFLLKKENSEEIDRRIEENRQKRTLQPTEPSAGCVFVNPKPESAGLLIEKAGLKKQKIGRAGISEKHANFIINLGGATAREVEELINLAREKVKMQFGIELKDEIVKIGEF